MPRVPWNKGLKYGDEFKEFKEACRRRMTGNKLSAETRQRLSVAHRGIGPTKDCVRKSSMVRSMRSLFGELELSNEHKMKIAKGVVASLQNNGWGNRASFQYESRSNGRVVFRSSWERKVAQWLDEHGYDWKYEVSFIETPYGVYVPDFTLTSRVFVEVKGIFSADQERKLEWCAENKYDVYVVDKEIVDDISLRKKLDAATCVVAARC